MNTQNLPILRQGKLGFKVAQMLFLGSFLSIFGTGAALSIELSQNEQEMMQPFEEAMRSRVCQRYQQGETTRMLNLEAVYLRQNSPIELDSESSRELAMEYHNRALTEDCPQYREATTDS
ncbi:MAG: hypothetical protein ACLFQP_02525 [Halothece sp.]